MTTNSTSRAHAVQLKRVTGAGFIYEAVADDFIDVYGRKLPPGGPYRIGVRDGILASDEVDILIKKFG